MRKEIQSLSESSIGVIRTGEKLKYALERLGVLKQDYASGISCRSREPVYNLEWVECLQIENLLTVCESIARSALHRKESRGSQYRRDYPASQKEWEKNIRVTNRNGEMDLMIKDVE